MESMISFKEFKSDRINEVISLYKEESWNAYLKDDDKLIRAFDNSLYLLGAFKDDKLIGFIRVLGDGEHFVIIQDLIVSKDNRRQGIATKLFTLVSNKYKDVRMFHVVTDIEDPIDNGFYQKMGMKKLKEGNMVSYYR